MAIATFNAYLVADGHLKILTLLTCLAACTAAESDRPQKLNAYIGMTARELNSQSFIKSRNVSLSESGNRWIVIKGPLELTTTVGGRTMSFRLTESNDNIMISGWRGLNNDFKDFRINTIGFFYYEKNLNFTKAISIGNEFCNQAYSNGLRATPDNNGVINNISERDFDKI